MDTPGFHERSKDEMLRALVSLGELGRDYRALLEAVWDQDAPDAEARRLLEAHRGMADAAAGAFSALDPAQALLRYTVAHLREPRVRFLIPAGGAPPALPYAENAESSDNADTRTFGALAHAMEAPLDALSRGVYGLAARSAAAREPRVQRVLAPVSALGKALLRQDWSDARLMLEHLHMATLSHDSKELVEQIGRLVRSIHSSLNEISLVVPVDALSDVSDEIPDAVDTLRGVIQELEAGAHRGLDCLESLTERSGEARQATADARAALSACIDELEALAAEHPDAADALGSLGDVLRQGAGDPLSECETRLGEGHDTYMTLLANQSYQDLTGQTLCRVIAFIEGLQYQLIQVISRERGLPTQPMPSAPQESAEEAGPDAKNRLTQGRVDAMLAELGF